MNVEGHFLIFTMLINVEVEWWMTGQLEIWALLCSHGAYLLIFFNLTQYFVCLIETLYRVKSDTGLYDTCSVNVIFTIVV